MYVGLDVDVDIGGMSCGFIVNCAAISTGVRSVIGLVTTVELRSSKDELLLLIMSLCYSALWLLAGAHVLMLLTNYVCSYVCT